MVGTFPLGLLVAGSDLDIACSSPDLDHFEAILHAALRSLGVTASSRRITLSDGLPHQQPDLPPASLPGSQLASVTSFALAGTPAEVFCQRAPVTEQHGFRHMIVEGRLLALGGPALRDLVLTRKRAGQKTEPAFAELLGLPGDPYQALLTLETASTERLQQLVHRAVRRATAAPELRVERYEGDREALRPLMRIADDSEQEIESYLRKGVAFVVREADDLVGHLLLTQATVVDGDKVLELKSMAILPHLQGLGLGRRLIEAAVAHCREHKTWRLLVATAAAGTGQLRFYQRSGFRFARAERDAFGPHNGYPEGILIDGIPLRDRVWLWLEP